MEQAATGTLECNYAIEHNTKWIQHLSVQELLDCATDAGNGCDGGDKGSAMQYAQSNGGLCLDDNYSYYEGFWGVTGECRADSCGKRYDGNVSVQWVEWGSASALKKAVSTGCVAVSINADDSFQYYSSGILTGTCSADTNHAVIAVGYGESNGLKYWKLKNQYGYYWYVPSDSTLSMFTIWYLILSFRGEDGYIRICRECNKNGNSGQCGVLENPIQAHFF